MARGRGWCRARHKMNGDPHTTEHWGMQGTQRLRLMTLNVHPGRHGRTPWPSVITKMWKFITSPWDFPGKISYSMRERNFRPYIVGTTLWYIRSLIVVNLVSAWYNSHLMLKKYIRHKKSAGSTGAAWIQMASREAVRHVANTLFCTLDSYKRRKLVNFFVADAMLSNLPGTRY